MKGVSCGTRHTAIVDDRGRLYVCGAGDAGQLGTGSREKEILPFYVASIEEKVIQSACGIFHTLVVTENGIIYAMGGNNFGQLGVGTKRSSTVPVKVKGLDDEKIIKVAAGHLSAALSERGIVYVWGTGVLGEILIPTALTGLKEQIIDIELGGCFGAALDRNGGIYTWGSNASGELGQGDYEQKAQPLAIQSLQDKPVSQISCGGSFAIALGKTIYHKYVPPSRTPAKARGTYEAIKKEPEGIASSGKKVPLHTDSANKPRIPEEKKIPKVQQETAETEIRKGKLNEDLLETYKVEQQRRKEIEKKVVELQEQNRLIQEKIRENETKAKLKEQEAETRFKEKIEATEKQLDGERQKCLDLLKKIDSEKERESALIKQREDLEEKQGNWNYNSIK